MLTIKRTCTKCGGPVAHNHGTFKVHVPARDEYGQPIIDWDAEKQLHVQRMVEVSARGLGKWRCVRGCQPTKVTTALTDKSS